MSGDAWITVVGVGDDGREGLGRRALRLIDAAEVLVGGARHHAMFPDLPAERLTWQIPIDDSLTRIDERRGRRVVVLATGDPLLFGVGEALIRRFGPAALHVVPAPSAFALACARLGWPRTEVETLSLHGRPAAVLRRRLRPGVRLLILSADAETPARVAAILAGAGYGPSRMIVLEHMGGSGERRIESSAEDWPDVEPADLNTVAVVCRAERDAPILPPFGLPDEAFRHDGQLTKREVRAVTLARLAPAPGHVLWDVGAGCGSISVEWLRACRRGESWAVERVPSRCALIAANAERLGTPEVRVIRGEAPAALEGLPAPDAVFVGGGALHKDVLPTCWRALHPGGRLVANAVSLEGARALEDTATGVGGDLVRLSIERVGPLGALHAWRPTMTVTQLAAVKPWP